MIKNKVLLIVLFLGVGCCFGQSTDPSDFSDIKANYKATKALQTRLQVLLDEAADQLTIEDKAHDVEILTWQMEELKRALNRPDSPVFDFLNESYNRLRTKLDEERAIAFFNKTYGHESIPYIFSGYVETRDDDYIYLYVAEPKITTYEVQRPERLRIFDQHRNQPLMLESKAEMINDTMLDQGFVYTRTFSNPLKGHTAKSEWAIGMANKRAELSTGRVKVYRDTNTWYNQQLKMKDREIQTISDEITSLRLTIDQLNRKMNSLRRYPDRQTEGQSIDSMNVEEVLAFSDQQIKSINLAIGKKEVTKTALKEEMKALEIDAVLEANDMAKAYFEEAWDTFWSVVDARIQMDINTSYNRPHILLLNWSIRRKTD